ncbi:MAG TPA: class I SAM-dependent methyltransferase [Gemmatimonadales bacterium]|nr:class I SAM-dependent methyltransferase [Gemmatimonadales bacterium]
MQERLIAQMREVEERHWWFRARREVLLSLVRSELEPGARFLDAGCGTGFFLEAARRFFDVTGLDPSPEAIAACARRGLHRTMQGGLEDLPAIGGGFDGAALFDVIEHLDDDVAALQAARGALRPGGRIFVTVPAYSWLWSHHDDIHGHRRRYTRSRLRDLLREAGCQQVRTGYFNARMFPVALAVRGWQRLTGLGRESDLRVPPDLINSLFGRCFAGEASRLGRKGAAGYPFGLSVFAVGTA